MIRMSPRQTLTLPVLFCLLLCLIGPAPLIAGPFTITTDRVKQGTETEIIITGPPLETYEVDYTDSSGVSHTESVTSGSALFKPHTTVGAAKGTTVTVRNTSESAIPATTFVASKFTPPSDIVVTQLTVQPGSAVTVGGNSVALSGGFTTIANAVDYIPSSPTYGTLSGVIPTSSFNVNGANLQIALSANAPWMINLASIWGQNIPDSGLAVPFSQPLSGTIFINSVPNPFTGNFTGTVTFFADNLETICGTINFGAGNGTLCGSADRKYRQSQSRARFRSSPWGW